MSDALLNSLFSADAVTEQTDDHAWLTALLDVEAALARAGARAGIIPAAAAETITRYAVAERFDAADLGRAAVASTTPVVPLVRALAAALPPAAADHVHSGATSQDIIDTAMCLVARRATAPIMDDLVAGAESVAGLAATYRSTPQVGRTLLQEASPTSFGLVCTGWLIELDEAAAWLARVRDQRLTVQFGGAVGTMAALGADGADGIRVAALLAEELGLPDQRVPWHTGRGRISELACALGTVAGALATVALDVTLLAQTEIREVSEGSPGGSSTLPGKRNQSRSVLITACAHRVPGMVSTILAGQPQALQRSAGRWQAEWQTITQLLRLVGAAAAHHRELVASVTVDPRRMLANLQRSEGSVMSESIAVRLAGWVGRPRANELVAAAAARAMADGVPLAEAIRGEPRISAVLPESDLAGALRPEEYLGAAATLVETALTNHRAFMNAQQGMGVA